jgi:hypothetical protein
MFRPIFVFLGLFTLQALLSGCPPCGPFDSSPFKIQSFEGRPLVMQQNGVLPPYEGGAVHYEDLYIEMLAELVKKKNFVTWSATGFSAAYACSPVEPQIHDTIVGISVKSDAVYNGIESGADLSEFFGWTNYYFDGSQDFSDISLVAWSPFFYIVIVEPPVEGGVHQFLITIELEDGRILEVDIPQIEIATAD